MHTLILIAYLNSTGTAAQVSNLQALPVGHFLTQKDCEEALRSFNLATDWRDVKEAVHVRFGLICVPSGNKGP